MTTVLLPYLCVGIFQVLDTKQVLLFAFKKVFTGLSLTYSELHVVKACDWMSFDVATQLWNHLRSQAANLPISPPKSPKPFTSIAASSRPQAATDLPSITVY